MNVLNNLKQWPIKQKISGFEISSTKYDSKVIETITISIKKRKVTATICRIFHSTFVQRKSGMLHYFHPDSNYNITNYFLDLNGNIFL